MKRHALTRFVWLAVGLSILGVFLVGGMMAPKEILKRADAPPTLWPMEAPAYEVEEPETLFRISMKTGVGVDTLQRLNDLGESSDVEPGTVLQTYEWTDGGREFRERALGTNRDGSALLDYAMQGASIVTLPALVSGFFVMFLAAIAGLARCAGLQWFDTALQVFSELAGALPRLVPVLLVATMLPIIERTELVTEWSLPIGPGLLPVGLTWALLVAPSAMDEAAATAGRLGGARFVEALRAHGFTAGRIYLFHVTWLNLRPVLVRQGAEVMMQVVFLEIALSYLASTFDLAGLTHSDSEYSWASLLYFGFDTVSAGPAEWLATGSQLHALIVGLGLLGLVALMAQSFRFAARAR